MIPREEFPINAQQEILEFSAEFEIEETVNDPIDKAVRLCQPNKEEEIIEYSAFDIERI